MLLQISARILRGLVLSPHVSPNAARDDVGPSALPLPTSMMDEIRRRRAEERKQATETDEDVIDAII